MKRLIIIFAVNLLSRQIMQAQGTVYISDLGQISAGNNPIGSNSWCAADFLTGPNAGGYTLDSIQLQMANATDNPNNLTAMLYSGVDVLAPRPKSYLVTLDGTANPSTAAVYTYTSGSNFLLSPSTWYFIVLTAGTSVADGAYNWSYGSPFGYVRSGGWLNDSGIYQSSDGSSWTLAGGSDWDAQFAITATAIPEPSMSWLLLLGSGVFLYVRRAFQC